MQENIKLQKPITEAKYLNQENTYRYRPIMRFLYNKYEQAEYWFYKEEIYNAVKNIIENYTLEECERDLEFLFENMSLDRMQDTENVNTLEEFKTKSYRYQLTDYGVAIERLTVELEELEVKVSSLEPKLFERIERRLKELLKVNELSIDKTFEIYNDLNSDFKNLNEQYQDFLKKFYEQKTEELLKSEVFLEYKSKMIEYIRSFISAYINSETSIRNTLLSFDKEKEDKIMANILSHQKQAITTNMNFDYDKLNEVNYGKWISIKKWFIPLTNGKSEGDRLISKAENAIQKIYKYASSLSELHGNMVNRREEYKSILKLFDKMTDIKDAHKLSSAIFGIMKVNHFKGSSNLNTDSLINSYNIDPIEIIINTPNKEYKIKNTPTIVQNKTEQKEKLLKEKQKEENERKEKLKTLVSSGKIKLVDEIKLDSICRRYILKLIENYKNDKIKETEFGYFYTIENKEGNCKIISEDGTFLMKAKEITIEVGDINE